MRRNLKVGSKTDSERGQLWCSRLLIPGKVAQCEETVCIGSHANSHSFTVRLMDLELISWSQGKQLNLTDLPFGSS